MVDNVDIISLLLEKDTDQYTYIVINVLKLSCTSL